MFSTGTIVKAFIFKEDFNLTAGYGHQLLSWPEKENVGKR